MYITTTGTIQAYLTRTGRQLLADNSAKFNISHYRFSDDEIDYSQFDGTTEDAPNVDILNTPILETTTLDTVPAQRYELFTGELGTQYVSWLDTNIGRPFVDGKQLERPFRETANLWLKYDEPNIGVPFNTSFTVKTLYGYDTQYYVSTSNPDIVQAASKRPPGIPDSDPTQHRQNQSMAEVKLVVTVKPTTIVSVDVADIPRRRPAAVDLQAVRDWTRVRTKAATDSARTDDQVRPSPPVRRDATARIDEPEVTRQIVPRYNNLKLARAVVTITGADTERKFQVNVFVYTPRSEAATL